MFSVGGRYVDLETPPLRVSKYYITADKKTADEQCLAGSLTGAIDS